VGLAYQSAVRKGEEWRQRNKASRREVKNRQERGKSLFLHARASRRGRENLTRGEGGEKDSGDKKRYSYEVPNPRTREERRKGEEN